MKDKPSFDDKERPETVTTPIEGMTDEQWVARNERQGRIVRRTVAILAGLAVGSLIASRFGYSPYALLAKWFVTVGMALFFYAWAEREARK